MNFRIPGLKERRGKTDLQHFERRPIIFIPTGKKGEGKMNRRKKKKRDSKPDVKRRREEGRKKETLESNSRIFGGDTEEKERNHMGGRNRRQPPNRDNVRRGKNISLLEILLTEEN